MVLRSQWIAAQLLLRGMSASLSVPVRLVFALLTLMAIGLFALAANVVLPQIIFGVILPALTTKSSVVGDTQFGPRGVMYVAVFAALLVVESSVGVIKVLAFLISNVSFLSWSKQTREDAIDADDEKARLQPLSTRSTAIATHRASDPPVTHGRLNVRKDSLPRVSGAVETIVVAVLVFCLASSFFLAWWWIPAAPGQQEAGAGASTPGAVDSRLRNAQQPGPGFEAYGKSLLRIFIVSTNLLFFVGSLVGLGARSFFGMVASLWFMATGAWCRPASATPVATDSPATASFARTIRILAAAALGVLALVLSPVVLSILPMLLLAAKVVKRRSNAGRTVLFLKADSMPATLMASAAGRLLTACSSFSIVDGTLDINHAPETEPGDDVLTTITNPMAIQRDEARAAANTSRASDTKANSSRWSWPCSPSSWSPATIDLYNISLGTGASYWDNFTHGLRGFHGAYFFLFFLEALVYAKQYPVAVSALGVVGVAGLAISCIAPCRRFRRRVTAAQQKLRAKDGKLDRMMTLIKSKSGRLLRTNVADAAAVEFAMPVTAPSSTLPAPAASVHASDSSHLEADLSGDVTATKSVTATVTPTQRVSDADVNGLRRDLVDEEEAIEYNTLPQPPAKSPPVSPTSTSKLQRGAQQVTADSHAIVVTNAMAVINNSTSKHQHGLTADSGADRPGPTRLAVEYHEHRNGASSDRKARPIVDDVSLPCAWGSVLLGQTLVATAAAFALKPALGCMMLMMVLFLMGSWCLHQPREGIVSHLCRIMIVLIAAVYGVGSAAYAQPATSVRKFAMQQNWTAADAPVVATDIYTESHQAALGTVTSGHVLRSGSYGASNKPHRYDMCDTNINGLKPVDHCFLAANVYVSDDVERRADALQWFSAGNVSVTPIDLPTSQTGMGYTAFRYNTSSALPERIFLVVRGTSAASDISQDALMFQESILWNLISSIAPFGSWPISLTQDFLGAVSDFEQLFGLDPHPLRYIDELLSITMSLQQSYPNATISISGHSLGGNLATIVGQRTGTQSVSFSGPGVVLASRKFKLPAVLDYSISFTVKPDNDVIPLIDEAVGAVHNTACLGSTSALACHKITRTCCELVRNCGDAFGRTLAECASF